MNTTYQIVLSTDGKQSVIVTSDNQAEIKLAAGWAKATYEGLVERYGLKYGPKPVKPQEAEVSVIEEAPICEVHQVPMVRVEGRKGPFWSCHERNADGSFCSYRPPKE